jgi:hypothetical protein
MGSMSLWLAPVADGISRCQYLRGTAAIAFSSGLR